MSTALPSFASQTVTRVRAGVLDDHGTSVPDWSDVDTEDITGCLVALTPGFEDRAGRDAITTVALVFAPAGSDVLDTDRITWDGRTYDIDGPVRRWETSVLDHLEIPLRLVEG